MLSWASMPTYSCTDRVGRILRCAGSHVTQPDRGAFMLNPLLPDLRSEAARRLFCIRTDWFLMSWLDVMDDAAGPGHSTSGASSSVCIKLNERPAVHVGANSASLGLRWSAAIVRLAVSGS